MLEPDHDDGCPEETRFPAVLSTAGRVLVRAVDLAEEGIHLEVTDGDHTVELTDTEHDEVMTQARARLWGV